MSLLPFTFPFALAISFFEQEVEVTDVIYATVDGRDVLQSPVNRTIRGAIDASGSAQLRQMFGGSVSDGSIGIYTSQVLHISDMHNPGSNQNQSYIVYGGLQYRVTDISNWTPQIGQNVYLAQRHVVQDVIQDVDPGEIF